MQRYRSRRTDTGVSAYEIGGKSITIKFKNGTIYLYDYASAGASAVERMKFLAARGRGLSTYISTTVKNAYAARLR